MLLTRSDRLSKCPLSYFLLSGLRNFHLWAFLVGEYIIISNRQSVEIGDIFGKEGNQIPAMETSCPLMTSCSLITHLQCSPRQRRGKESGWQWRDYTHFHNYAAQENKLIKIRKSKFSASFNHFFYNLIDRVGNIRHLGQCLLHNWIPAGELFVVFAYQVMKGIGWRRTRQRRRSIPHRWHNWWGWDVLVMKKQ